MSQHSKNSNFSQILKDIEFIKAIIDQNGAASKARPSSFALIVNTIGLVLASCLFVFDLMNPGFISLIFQSADSDTSLRLQTLFIILTILIFGSSIAYLLSWKKSKKEMVDIHTFIEKNVSYLKVQSFSADLIVKFLILAAVFLYQKSELVPTLLMLFTADYLFQNKYFYLHKPVQLSFGVVVIALTAFLSLQMKLQVGHALLTFIALNILSIGNFFWQSKSSK